MRTKYLQRNITVDDFGDIRLNRRFDMICEQFSNNLSATIPQAGITKKAVKAMYRFFDNKQVTPYKQLFAHRPELDKKISALKKRRFLQLDDSSEADMTGKKGAQALGPLNYINRRGLWLHNSLITDHNGAPLGLLHQSYIIRNDEDFGKAAERKKLPFEDKESYRWKEHYLKGQALCEQHEDLEGVYVADREADIMELYQARSCERMHFVQRSKHNRKLADKSDNLYNHLSKQRQVGTYELGLIHPQTKKKRVATIEVRFTKVELKLHKALPSKRHLPAVTFYAVEAKEINPPQDIDEPIHWVLLTTLPVESFEDAMEIIRIYTLRWIIERYHYILKTGGAHIEDLQLETPHRLKNAITAYSIAALKALTIRYYAEKTPQVDIYQIGITETEYKVLYTYAQYDMKLNVHFDADNIPTIKEFCIVLGQIGGFIPSKRQPLPGLKILSRATQKLNNMVDTYLVFCQRTE